MTDGKKNTGKKTKRVKASEADAPAIPEVDLEEEGALEEESESGLPLPPSSTAERPTRRRREGGSGPDYVVWLAIIGLLFSMPIALNIGAGIYGFLFELIGRVSIWILRLFGAGQMYNHQVGALLVVLALAGWLVGRIFRRK